MTYVDKRTNGGKLGAGIAVAALHAGIGAALLATFAGGAIQEAVDKALNAQNWTYVLPPPHDRPIIQPSSKAVDRKIFVPPVDNGLELKDPMLDTTIDLGPVKPVDLGEGGGGIEPQPRATQTPVARPKLASPRGNLGEWVTRDDYPARAIREEWTGVTRFRLDIGADGRVTGCTVTAGSGHEELDRVACTRVGARARFEPAMDENGAKVVGTYAGAIRWEIE